MSVLYKYIHNKNKKAKDEHPNGCLIIRVRPWKTVGKNIIVIRGRGYAVPKIKNEYEFPGNIVSVYQRVRTRVRI